MRPSGTYGRFKCLACDQASDQPQWQVGEGLHAGRKSARNGQTVPRIRVCRMMSAVGDVSRTSFGMGMQLSRDSDSRFPRIRCRKKAQQAQRRFDHAQLHLEPALFKLVWACSLLVVGVVARWSVVVNAEAQAFIVEQGADDIVNKDVALGCTGCSWFPVLW